MAKPFYTCPECSSRALKFVVVAGISSWDCLACKKKASYPTCDYGGDLVMYTQEWIDTNGEVKPKALAITQDTPKPPISHLKILEKLVEWGKGSGMYHIKDIVQDAQEVLQDAR